MTNIFEAHEAYAAAVDRYAADRSDANREAVGAAARALEEAHDASYAQARFTMPDRESAEAMLDIMNRRMFIRGSRIARRRNGLPGYSLSIHGYWNQEG